MRLTHEAREILRAVLAIEDFPEDVYVDLATADVGCLQLQATTQDEVRRVRAVFPTVHRWKKTPPGNFSWWQYTGENTDRDSPIRTVHIYACREAPPTCRAIEETVTVREKVPVTFEDRDVTKTVIRWECGGEE